MEAIIVAEERAEQAEGLAKSYRDALSAKAKESLVDSKSVATCDNLDMGETTSALESSRLVAERSTASAEKLLQEAARLQRDKERASATLHSLKSGFDRLVEKVQNMERKQHTISEAGNQAVAPSLSSPTSSLEIKCSASPNKSSDA